MPRSKRPPTLYSLYAILLLAFLPALAPSPALATDPVVIAFDQDYRPYYFGGSPTDARPMQGMLIEFLEAFSKEHPEFPIIRRMLSRKRMDVALDEFEVQAFALNNPKFVDPKLREKCLFTTPLWTTTDHLLILRRNAERFHGISNLKGMRIGLQRGYGYGEYEKVLSAPGVERIMGNNQVSNLHMLAAGRIDAMVISRDTAPGCIHKAGLDIRDFQLIRPEVINIPLSMQIRAERADFFRVMEAFIQKSKENGLLQSLEAAYVNSEL